MNPTSDVETRVRALLADALNLPAAEVTPDLALGDRPEWDSVGHMEVMLLLEEQVGIELNPENIARLVNFAAICAAVSEVTA
jgi:acyl carrier protein